MTARKKQTSSFPFFLPEAIVVIGLLLFCMTISFVGASKLPLNLGSGWDEVMFIDPAIRLYSGQGFNSSAWFAQTQNEFWAGYPPFYTFLLYLYIKIFGLSIGVSRIVNATLAIITVTLIWHATIRFKLISSARVRILLVALLTGIIGVGLDYRSGRPDILMALLVTSAFWICSLNAGLIRYSLLIFIGFLLPWSGLAIIAYTIVLGSILILFLRRNIIKEILAVISGVIIGGATLFSFYQGFGVWDVFVSSIINNPSITIYKTSFLNSLGLRDRGFLMLGFVVIVIFAWKTISKNNSFKSPATFGLASMILIPLGMFYLGAYPKYYAWMTSIPLAICICAELSRLSKPSSNFLLCSILLFFMSGNYGLLIFIPVIFYFCFKLVSLFKLDLNMKLSSLLVAISFLLWLNAPPIRAFDLMANWDHLDYSPVQNFVRKSVKPTDWVMTDFLPYYAVRQEAAVTMYDFYLKAMPNFEKEKVSVLIVQADKDVRKIIETLGGNWYMAENLLLLKTNRLYNKYSYEIDEVEFHTYRRLDAG